MYKLKLFSNIKTKEPWLQLAIEEYIRRLRPILSIDWYKAKSEPDLANALSQAGPYIALDAQGISMDSQTFSKWFFQQFTLGGSKLQIGIGGAHGLSKSTLEGATHLISLSPMTFTHQIAHLLFFEQLYRSFAIERNHPYHK